MKIIAENTRRQGRMRGEALRLRLQEKEESLPKAFAEETKTSETGIFFYYIVAEFLSLCLCINSSPIPLCVFVS
jgi:hypothetical protein